MPLHGSFWTYQLKTVWRDLDDLTPLKRGKSFLKLSRDMLERHRTACSSPVTGLGVDHADKLTVILLNHKRPENVGFIARVTLRCGFVGNLVISNNSQEYPIEKFIHQTDPRLVLLNQDRPSGVGIRFELARRYPARYYLCLDDDIFLHPTQLQWIYWSLRLASDRPHGIFGAALSADTKGKEQWPFAHQRNRTGVVDILNGLFAFTSTHLDEYFRLCALLGIQDPKHLMNGEDIVLSFSGDKKPLIHNVGPIWECASASSPGIALYMSRPRFYDERWRIFSELQRKKPLAREDYDDR